MPRPRSPSPPWSSRCCSSWSTSASACCSCRRWCATCAPASCTSPTAPAARRRRRSRRAGRRSAAQADPEARAVGLDLAERLDPAPLLDELRQLAPSADRPTRRSWSRLLARAPAPQLGPLLDELLGRCRAGPADRAAGLLARATLAAQRRSALPHRPPQRRCARAARPARPQQRWGGHAGRRDPAVVRRCGGRRRRHRRLRPCRPADAADLLIALIETAPLEQQRHGLAVLAEMVPGAHAGAAALGAR